MPSSGGSSFHVDPNALTRVLEILADFGTRAEAFIADVEAKVDDLHVDWTGETAAAHLEAQRQWATGAAEMRTVVGQLHEIVTRAHGNYGSAAAANTAMWQR